MCINNLILDENSYVKFLLRLKEKYPVPDVMINLELSWMKSVSPSGKEVEGYFSWIDSKNCRICLSIGAAERTLKDNLSTLAHEYKHCLQYYVEGKLPKSDWDYEIESEAYAFAHSEIGEYLTNEEYNTSYMELSGTVMSKLREISFKKGLTLDVVVEEALSKR